MHPLAHFKINSPAGLVALEKTPEVQTIMPGNSTHHFASVQSYQTPLAMLSSACLFKACGLGDAFHQKNKNQGQRFSGKRFLLGQEKKKYTFTVSNLVNGSLRACFSAYPNVVTDLLKGVEGILQEPYGCFEQTSCTAYPNAMVLDYMKHTDNHDTKTLARATDLLTAAVNALPHLNPATKGYEGFGAIRREGLTAYGINGVCCFMKKAGQDVDQGMLDRTARWLLNHKDGKGGFAREQHAYHDFGRISDDILNAYIVYALSDAGYTDIKKEFESSYNKALSSKTPLHACHDGNASFSMKENTRQMKL